MLEHGGRLREAAQRFGIPLAEWLDLSTGLAPWCWPLPAINACVWRRLPESEDGLEQAARDYYGAASLLPVAGSQAAIQALPRLRPACRVAIIGPCYAEHQYAWESSGHQVLVVSVVELVVQGLAAFDVVVVVNPDNPTGRLLPRATLLDWHAQLARRGGWLLVDEAFADLQPQHSLADCSDRPGLLVLRSLGKFFGLAGLRLGFVLAEQGLLAHLQRLLGPWAVSGPARVVGQAALADRTLQQTWRQQLRQQGQRLHGLLSRRGLIPDGGCALFQWLAHGQAEVIHQQMAERGILLRLYDRPRGLRIGLPGDEAGWARLEQALIELQLDAGGQEDDPR